MPSEADIQEQSAHRLLHPGPTVPGHTIQQDGGQSILVIDQVLVVCTPQEYCLLTLLLEQANRRVPFAQLAAYLPALSSSDEVERGKAKRRMRHVMSGLRTKIWMLGLDIVSVRGVGYILLSSMQEESARSR